jgi:tRNA threonylcarbamoyladenosine modification (KEOPS) complex  Pcc1 subunit
MIAARDSSVFRAAKNSAVFILVSLAGLKQALPLF